MDTVTRIILCVFILGGIIALLFMNRSKGANYDERQLLYRGRAVSLAFGTLITFLGIVLLLNTQDLPWLDVPMFVIIGIILSLTVFIVYSILHDAYFSTITKKGSGGIFFFIIAFLNFFNGIRHVFSNTAEDIYDIVLPVVIGTMLLAALFLNEKITGIKLLGVCLGIAGAALLVLVKWQTEAGSNDLLGIFFALMSLLTWVIYLIITSKVSAKYSAVTQMKWTFLVSTIAVLPFAWNEFGQTKLFSGGYGFSEGLMGIGGMAFIVIFATVMGYFMIPYAMKYLRATTVSIYTNLQPIVASLIAIAIGQDILTWDKPVAAVLVLVGAYLVTQKQE